VPLDFIAAPIGIAPATKTYMRTSIER